MSTPSPGFFIWGFPVYAFPAFEGLHQRKIGVGAGIAISIDASKTDSDPDTETNGNMLSFIQSKRAQPATGKEMAA